MYWFMLGIVILLSLAVQFFFGCRKMGFHEDEYYSFYSTNMTSGWNVPDGEWVNMQHYRNEFMVLEGEGFQYDKVKLVQSWDVHPPVYYWVLHTVCSLTPGIFSKWQGIGLNMLFSAIGIIFLYASACLLLRGKGKEYGALALCLCYALSPATISSTVFIRMYTMLAAWVLLAVYIHARAWTSGRFLKLSFLLLLLLSVYVGFLTHYYFLLFHFFLTAATCIGLLLRKKKWKYPLIYGGTVLAALFLAYLTYPVCLGQMFRGQRGAEATANMFDLSSLFQRLKFFGGLVNKYLFGGALLLIALLLFAALAVRMYKKGQIRKEEDYAGGFGVILLLAAVGYFLTVSKSALMLGDTSLRYIQPIFGVLLLLIFVGVADLLSPWGRKISIVGVSLITTFFAVCNLAGILGGKVLFLYPEAQEKIAYAKVHQDIPAVYIYQQGSSWCVWGSASELFEYPQVYFVSNARKEPFEDERLEKASELLVYIYDGDQTEQLERVLASATKLKQYEVVCKSKFCTLFHFSE